MSPKEELFCDEYLLDLNGAQAAIRAGYSQRSARGTARRLLTKEHIQARIAERQAERAHRTNVTGDRVVEELSSIGFSNLVGAFQVVDGKLCIKDPTTLPEGLQRAISTIAPVKIGKEVYYRIGLYDKVRALDALGKYLGLFSDFNMAIATLKTYGVNLQQSDDGWIVKQDKEAL